MRSCLRCGTGITESKLLCSKCEINQAVSPLSLGAAAAAAPKKKSRKFKHKSILDGQQPDPSRPRKLYPNDTQYGFSGSDLTDPDGDAKHCNQLTLLIIAAQLFGLLLIWLALAVLSIRPPWNVRANLIPSIGLIALFIAIVWVWGGDWTDLFSSWKSSYESKQHGVPVGKKNERLMISIFGLVLCDTVILLSLIAITGGFGHSSFDALLPVIPVIAIILRQPRSTVFGALFLQIVATALIGMHWIADKFKWPPHPKWLHVTTGYDPFSDNGSTAAFAILSIGAVILSLCEYHFSHHSSLEDGLETWLEDMQLPPKEHSAIGAGLKKWQRWLESQSMPLRDWSLVHGSDVLAQQAAILSLPYWHGEATEKEQHNITKFITFITYAAHWIDDQCDPVLPHAWMTNVYRTHGKVPDPNGLSITAPKMQQLIKKIYGMVPVNNRELVDIAVRRVMYGGLIQNASSKDELDQLLSKYIEYVSQATMPQFRNIFQSVRPITAWLTTKVVMQLFDSCKKPYSNDQMEFFNVLYGPIIFYQDIEAEMEYERFGKGFGDGRKQIEQTLPSLNELVYLVSEICVQLKKQLFENDKLPQSRQVQLQCLRKTFKPPEPLYAAYDIFLDGIDGS